MLAHQCFENDRAALRASCEDGVGLCTITGIEGSFSRRLGAQLAIHADGRVTGSLADGCLESQLAAEIGRGGERRVMRFGAGSPLIDFRLPCGSGLDILIDPAPDRAASLSAVQALAKRQEAALPLPCGDLPLRCYVPALRLQLFGEGPEVAALAALAATIGVETVVRSKDSPALVLGQAPQDVLADRWTAIVLLFHDHEWEEAILNWALGTPACFIGAQGGGPARVERVKRLQKRGWSERDLERIASPVGIVGHSREPAPLALSVLAQIVGIYESMHPHG